VLDGSVVVFGFQPNQNGVKKERQIGDDVQRTFLLADCEMEYLREYRGYVKAGHGGGDRDAQVRVAA